jgi:integrase
VISKSVPLRLLNGITGNGATVHGFRSSFRDWAAERTSYPREVAEQALAHTIGNAVEAAYRRGDLFDKRARLMQSWADYCAKPAATGRIVPIRRG